MEFLAEMLSEILTGKRIKNFCLLFYFDIILAKNDQDIKENKK